MSIPPKAFIVIRHGQTNANRDGLIAGRIEALLTEKGRASASALADLDWPQNLQIFASPQIRAQDTARLAFPHHAITPIQGLRERNWGIFEGRSVAEQPPREGSIEGGESWADLLARVSAALEEIFAQTAPEITPVLVAHSGVVRAIRAITGDLAGTALTGPSPLNTTPYLYSPTGAGTFTEAPLFA